MERHRGCGLLRNRSLATPRPPGAVLPSGPERPRGRGYILAGRCGPRPARGPRRPRLYGGAVRTEAGTQHPERGGPGGARPLASCPPAAVSPRAGTGGPVVLPAQ